MYKNAKDKGITLVSLVVTIVLLLILSTIAYETGKGTIESAKLSAYRAEMTIMQEEVDNLEQQFRQGKISETEIASLGKDWSEAEGASEAFIGAGVEDEDKSGYRYFTADDLKALGIENIENDYLINIQKRSVISLNGVKYHGEKYYTISDENLPGGKYIVEHQDQASEVSFDLNENIQGDKMKIDITNITYAGDVKKGTIYYGLGNDTNSESVTTWTKAASKTTDTSYTIEVLQEGTYWVKIVDTLGNEKVQSIQIRVASYTIAETGVKYSTIENAVTAAENGQTITQTRNCVDSSTAIVTGDKSITFNTNSRTLTTSNTITVDNNSTLTVVGNGTIKTSENIAVFTNNGTLNIGDQTATYSTSSPIIQGGTYGVSTTGTFNFYNGILKGKTAGNNGTITNTRSSYLTRTGTETIGGTTYNTTYLEKIEPNYLVDNTIETQTLAEAVETASNGSTIKLLRNYTDTSNGTISKNVTLDLQTYTLTRSATVTVNSGVTATITGSTGSKLTTGTTNLNTITNAGTLTIDGSVTIEHNGTNTSFYAINNSTAGAKLNVKSGTIISASYGIYNNNSTAVTNIGDSTSILSTTNPTISGGTYGVYNESGKWTYSNGNIKGTTSSFYDGDVEANGGLEGGVRTDYIIVTGESGSYKTAHLEKMTDVTTPWLPSGASYTNTDLNTGVTMKDSYDNEWTWVVVPKTVTASASVIGANEDPTDSALETALKNYAATVVARGSSYTDTWVSETQSGFTSDEYTTKKRNMLNGIKANGGFWIGKYEMGYLDTPTSSNYQSTTRTAVVQKDAYPYNYINLPNSAQKTEQLAMQAGGDGSMLFGTQWDLTIGYLVNRGGISKYSATSNSTNWGNYYNKELNVVASTTKPGWPMGLSGTTYNWREFIGTKSNASQLLSTGAVEDVTNKLNVVDLAGNFDEYTMEAYGANVRAFRGGSSFYNGSVRPASYRNYFNPTGSSNSFSSRPSLYVELDSAYAIGGTEYYTLKDAIEHVSDGDTITVLRDVKDLTTVLIDKNVTINLQGYTINRKTESITIDSGCTVNIQGTGEITSTVTALTNNGTLNITNSTITSTSSYYGISNGGTLTINNCIIRGGNYAISNGSSLIMNGGTIEATGTGATSSGIYNVSGTNSSSAATVMINSGTIKGGTYGIYNKGSYATTNIGNETDTLSTTSPVVSGGTYGVYVNAGKLNFYNGILKGTNAGYYNTTPNIRTGCAIVTDTEEIDGTTYQTAFLSDSIYSITDNGTTNYYITLSDAVSAATDGQTIKTLHNVSDTSAVTINKNITLDLQTYTITRTSIITVSRGYTVNIQGTGGITSSSTALDNDGTLNISNCTIESRSTLTYCSGMGNNGTLTINNATIKGYYYAISSSVEYNSYEISVTINGGTIETTATSGNRYAIINKIGKKTVTINSGTIKGGTYGIYNYATTNIGNSADTLSASNPSITGGEYGVYNDGGTWNFYNGIILGGRPSAYNEAPTAVRSGYGISTENQVIDGTTYNAAYLEAGRLVLSNTGGTVVAGNSTTATVTGDNVGTLSAVSGDTSIATASISGNVLTVTGTGEGNTTITVTESNAGKTAVYFITVREANYSITDGGNTVYHNTLAEAIAGTTAGQTIKVEKDVEDSTTATVNKNLTLDLQNYTLTRTATINISSGYTLDLKGTGTLTNTSSNISLIINNSGTLNITENTTLSNVYSSTSAYAISNSGTGTVNISNGTISATNQTIRNYNCNGKVNITGGTIQTTATTGTRYGIYNYSTNSSYKPKVYITGGIIQNVIGTSGTGYGICNYGAYATTYIGNSTDTLNTSTPMVLGRTYGMYNSSGKWYFYNGVIGSTGTAYSGTPTHIRELYEIASGTKTVDETTYNTAFLDTPSFYVTPRIKGVGIGKTDTITAGGTDYGEVTAVSSNTNIATVSVSGDTITITGVAEGTCTITATEGTNGKTDICTVQVTEPNYSITSAGITMYYKTLALAIAGAEDGDTIKVEQDVTDTSTATINKDVTLDLQTYTLTRSATVIISSGKNVTITGSTGGKLTSGTANVQTITNSGTLTIDGDATIEHNGTGTSYYAITNSTAGAILNVKSGTITSVTRGIYNNNSTATTNIGDSTQAMNTTNPVIIGGTHGVYVNNGTVNFYSGILKGKTAGYYGTINTRDEHGIETGTEDIEGATYNTAYLFNAYPFPTDYGTIDVIWLSGTTNTVTTTPNAPVLTSNGESMTPVTWTYDSGTETWSEDTTTQATWYNYNAVSTREASGHTTDNNTSMWANAKTANGAYFVWIPKFAYRITYYESETSTTPTGYYDGNGMWRASDGAVKYPLDSGVETVTYNGKSYIVHPAFETDLDLGGWDSDLSGFWFAKYEMSGESISALTSVPGVASKRIQSIGDQYLWGRQATYGYTGTSETLSSNGTNYTYTSYMSSHIIKNSEWGAVAYLTHSQYGRNGNEIDINNSSSYITGNGGGSTSASSASGTTNEYNTSIGVKASTTGNIYGVYDMSGGAQESIASYNSLSTSTYMVDINYGLKLTREAKDSNGNYESTKYITAYSNGTSVTDGNTIVYGTGKIGDATKEVYLGGKFIDNTCRVNWHSDTVSFCATNSPFLTRGECCSSGSVAGVFNLCWKYGGYLNNQSFRTALCP